MEESEVPREAMHALSLGRGWFAMSAHASVLGGVALPRKTNGWEARWMVG